MMTRAAATDRVSLLRIRPVLADLIVAAGRWAAAMLVVASYAPVAQAQLNLTAATAGDLALVDITAATGGVGQVTQMQFFNGQLYVATTGDPSHELGGVWRFDYSETGLLANRVRVYDGDGLFGNGSSTGSTSLAFHDDGRDSFMYVSDVASIFSPGADSDVGTLRRVTDSNGDGIWGGPGDVNQVLTNNVPIEGQHRINQIQIIGDTLYAGVGNLSTNGSLESAYSGTISFIKDLNLLQGNYADNVSRLPGPYATGGIPSTNDAPFTSTDDAAFRVHSSGLRNPFGLAVDGDNDLWITMNQDQTGVPDELFENPGAQERADYGFPQHNPAIPGSWGNDPQVAAAGFFNPANRIASFTSTSNADPNNLGSSTAVGGIDFATSNLWPLKYHRDAFIGRWVPGDVVSVDTVTSQVTPIASGGGVGGALEVVADPFGNILVAQARNAAGSPVISRIYRLAAASDATRGDGVHEFDWNSQPGPDGNWSDRQRWLADYDNDGVIDAPFNVDPHDQFVPDQWGNLRYAVRIERFGVVAGVATVDQDVQIDSLLLGGDMQLEVQAGITLATDNDVTVRGNGTLRGSGTLRIGGVFTPGNATDSAPFGGRLALGPEARLDLSLAGSSSGEYDVLRVADEVELGGSLRISLEGGFVPGSAEVFQVISAGSLHNQFTSILVSDGSLVLTPIYTPTSLSLTVAAVFVPGDINGDGIVNGTGTGDPSSDDVAAFVAGWLHTQAMGDIHSRQRGDLDQNGVTDLFDWAILRSFHPDGPGLNLGALLAVPEPSVFVLLAAATILIAANRPPRGQRAVI
jgi:glucose/arabinose dehydrogenase